MNSLLLAVLTLATTAAAGPFGLSFTPTREELLGMDGEQDTQDSQIWNVYRPPQAETPFGRYFLALSPAGHLCAVIANTPTMTTPSDGEALRAEFARLKAVYQPRFGPGEDADTLSEQGKVRSPDPEDWMQALRLYDRTYTTTWNAGTRSTLPDGIGEIVLDMQAMNETQGWITLTYYVPNTAGCARGEQDHH